MRGLADRGKTVLVSSHILSEVQQVADTVSIIGRGTLLAEGDVEDILSGGGESVRVGVVDEQRAATLLVAAGFGVIRNPDRSLTITRTDGVLDPAVIARLLGEQGLWVHELTPQRDDLERVFLQLDRAGAPRRHPARRPHPALRIRPDRDGAAPMIHLLRAELTRFLNRKISWIAFAVVLLALAGMTLLFALQTAPPSQAQIDQATTYYEQEHADWESSHEGVGEGVPGLRRRHRRAVCVARADDRQLPVPAELRRRRAESGPGRSGVPRAGDRRGHLVADRG